MFTRQNKKKFRLNVRKQTINYPNHNTNILSKFTQFIHSVITWTLRLDCSFTRTVLHTMYLQVLEQLTCQWNRFTSTLLLLPGKQVIYKAGNASLSQVVIPLYETLMLLANGVRVQWDLLFCYTNENTRFYESWKILFNNSVSGILSWIESLTW